MFIIEKTYNQVSKELKEEEAELCENFLTKRIKIAEIAAITAPGYLCDVLVNDKHA